MKPILILMLLAAMCGAAYGQVTIGAGLEPVKGALLDLKEEDSNGDKTATKGLMLPRVKLTEPDKLYPMFENATQPGTPAADYDDAAKKKAQDDIHTGLTVYNLGCDGKFARGVYTWTGTEWVQLTNNPILTGGNPVLTFPTDLINDSYLVRIPSGQDGRGNGTATPINFTWGSATLANWSNLVDNSSGSMSGGLTFNDAGSGLTPAGVPDLTGTGTWTTPGASALTITPDNLSSIETANPWATRQSKVTISVPVGGSPCPGGTDQTQVITLNQTNYKIVPSTSTSTATSGIAPISLRILRNTSALSLYIHSNVSWKATTTASADQLAKVLVSDDLTNATVKGGDKSDGTKYTPLTGAGGSKFDYQSVAVKVNDVVKYETVDVIYEDANIPKRAPDITVTFMQCQGLEDMSSVTRTATPAQTAAGDAGWNTGATKAERVVRHRAKPNLAYVSETSTPNEPVNIYEEFYSADFGDAGRWMTTNLTAWAYDWPSGTLPALGGVNASSSTDPRWCYPKVNGTVVADEAAPTEWISQYGLLYNSAAATGKQNTSTADQGQVAGASPGPNEVETVFGKIQGICPAGWHLPSDREWNQLEKEIYNSPQLYSTYRADELPFTSTYNAGVGAGSDGTAQTGWRPEWETGTTENNAPTIIGGRNTRGATPATRYSTPGHGLAMSDPCGLKNAVPSASSGRSRPLAAGGFNADETGRFDGPTVYSYGNAALYWTASKISSESPYTRLFQYTSSGISRQTVSRSWGMSVRCKKD